VFSVTGELKTGRPPARRGHRRLEHGQSRTSPTPQAHYVDKLVEAALREDTHGYSVSKGIHPPAQGDLRLVPDGVMASTFDPESEAVVTIGSKEGLAHLAAGDAGAGRHRCWCRTRSLPDPHLRGGDSPARTSAHVRDARRMSISSRRSSSRHQGIPYPKPKMLIRQFSEQPDGAAAWISHFSSA
jgi:alanine-synthesizing transaminase